MKPKLFYQYGRWTIEYRQEVRQWELKEGTAHRGLFRTIEHAQKCYSELAYPHENYVRAREQ